MNQDNKRQRTIASFLLMFSMTMGSLYAQQSVNSSGGDATGIGSFSYSLGQIVYLSAESTVDDASFIQGVQIPIETYAVTSCATDFNIDGITNGEDFSIFLGNFGLTCAGCPTDLNADGITNGEDFSIFLGNFGLICN